MRRPFYIILSGARKSTYNKRLIILHFLKILDYIICFIVLESAFSLRAAEMDTLYADIQKTNRKLKKYLGRTPSHLLQEASYKRRFLKLLATSPFTLSHV